MNRVKKALRDAGLLTIAVTAVLLFPFIVNAGAVIDGIEGISFSLTAKADHISTPIGGSVLIWGYANDISRAQYPGPTLIVNQGALVTVTLTNNLPAEAGNVSIVFPGQEVSVTDGVSTGLLTNEALPGGTVTYTFTASRAGTYLYHSGTRPELQVEMGLLGVIIVRPYGFSPSAPRAYSHTGSAYDHEYLFLLSEMDPRIHEVVEFTPPDDLNVALANSGYLSDYFPNYWFINGRNAPDTMAMAGVSWLPTQPYNCMPRMRPGERMLMRVVSAGRDMHPLHHHGNHARVIAKDGRLLETGSGTGDWPDLSYEVFTVQAVPGETVDAIFEWTGKGLGWDMYGHATDDPLEPNEYELDHGKPFPVNLPAKQNLTFGGFYSGSPFLGSEGSLPPGEGGLNPYAGFAYMWHSHTEKEMTNYDIFPGGMMTMMIIEPPWAPIE